MNWKITAAETEVENANHRKATNVHFLNFNEVGAFTDLSTKNMNGINIVANPMNKLKQSTNIVITITSPLALD